MGRRNNISLSLALILFLSLGLVGCGDEVLYQQLTQDDANRVMVLLQQHGIEASLEQEVFQNEVFWSIKVNKQEISRARELVVTSQVISPRAPGLKEIYQPKGSGGWIKTPAEERARFLLALKGEIVNSLKRLPEVVDADVVLNIPEEDALGLKEKKRPTASVVLKAKPPATGPSSLNEIQIQQFVANSVDGMAARDVSVLLHFISPSGTRVRPGETVLLPPARTPSAEAGVEAEARLMGLKLDAASKERLKVYLIIFFAVLVLLSAALIVSILQTSRSRQELKTLRSGQAPAIEGRVIEEGGRARLQAPEEAEKEEE